MQAKHNKKFKIEQWKQKTFELCYKMVESIWVYVCPFWIYRSTSQVFVSDTLFAAVYFKWLDRPDCQERKMKKTIQDIKLYEVWVN